MKKDIKQILLHLESYDSQMSIEDKLEFFKKSFELIHKLKKDYPELIKYKLSPATYLDLRNLYYSMGYSSIMNYSDSDDYTQVFEDITDRNNENPSFSGLFQVLETLLGGYLTEEYEDRERIHKNISDHWGNIKHIHQYKGMEYLIKLRTEKINIWEQEVILITESILYKFLKINQI
jgi:hypothetical protein